MSTYDNVIKLLVIGDDYVGKSALLRRLNSENFSNNYIETIGIDCKIRMVAMDGNRIRMQVWDTAGIAKLNTVTPAYFDRAFGIVLVFNIADRKTFNNLQAWFQLVQEYASNGVEKLIIGNKADLEEHRQVYKSEAKQFAMKTNSLYFETSAKTNYNINDAFSELMRRIMANGRIAPYTRVNSQVPPHAVDCPETSSVSEQKIKRKDKSAHKEHQRHSGCTLT